MPKNEVVIYGSIITKNEVNITRESFSKKMAQKMAKLPLDSALKIGNGKISVVEFMDPNCFHCRQAYKFFSQRKDVTMNIFFFPLSKESGDRIKQILCSKDVLKTYDDVMNEKLDKNAQLPVCTDKKVEETVKTHMQLASQIGVRGTPLFYMKGQVVDGFDAPVIEKILKD
jgi:thiol:disulfide interchange protein DsbC